MLLTQKQGSCYPGTHVAEAARVSCLETSLADSTRWVIGSTIFLPYEDKLCSNREAINRFIPMKLRSAKVVQLERR